MDNKSVLGPVCLFIIIVGPNKVNSYIMFGPIYLSVCLSVPNFRTWNDLVFGTVVEFGSEKDPIDFRVNQERMF